MSAEPGYRPIEPMLFEHQPAAARAALAAGVRELLVDWEWTDKARRQQGYDTEIRPATAADLAAVAALPGARVWCRINRDGPHTAAEVERALAAGATGLFLPMVTAPAEVERFLRLIDGRARAGILVETREAVACAADLARLPLDRVYFGLNDFAISRGGGSIFRAVRDGTVERMAETFAHLWFGFGGLTVLARGEPIPCRLLLAEMVRLGCRFSFLRRSFRRDTVGADVGAVLAELEAYARRCAARTPAEAAVEAHSLACHIAAIDPPGEGP